MPSVRGGLAVRCFNACANLAYRNARDSLCVSFECHGVGSNQNEPIKRALFSPLYTHTRTCNRTQKFTVDRSTKLFLCEQRVRTSVYICVIGSCVSQMEEAWRILLIIFFICIIITHWRRLRDSDSSRWMGLFSTSKIVERRSPRMMAWSLSSYSGSFVPGEDDCRQSVPLSRFDQRTLPLSFSLSSSLSLSLFLSHDWQVQVPRHEESTVGPRKAPEYLCHGKVDESPRPWQRRRRRVLRYIQKNVRNSCLWDSHESILPKISNSAFFSISLAMHTVQHVTDSLLFFYIFNNYVIQPNDIHERYATRKGTRAN